MDDENYKRRDSRFVGFAGLAAALLAAHIAGDLFLRVDAWTGIWRTTQGYLVHVFIWSSLISIVLAVYKRFAIWKFVFLFLTHYIIDTNNLYFFTFGGVINHDVADQILHMISIILVVLL